MMKKTDNARQHKWFGGVRVRKRENTNACDRVIQWNCARRNYWIKTVKEGKKERTNVHKYEQQGVRVEKTMTLEVKLQI